MTNAPISIYVTNLGKYNEGELVGEWVDLPICEDELLEVYKRIGINTKYEEIFLSDYESTIEGVTRYISEYTPIEDLNALATALNGLNDSEGEIYQAMLEAGIYPINSIKSLIDLISHLDEMTLIDDIEDEDDLGHYFFDEMGYLLESEKSYLQWYFNYERYGQDVHLNLGGSFTSYGYLY